MLIVNLFTSAHDKMRIIQVSGAGVAIVNGLYHSRSSQIVPAGFANTCRKMGWPSEPTWKRLSVPSVDWFEHENGSYIYLHQEGQWWIDEPTGGGVYLTNNNMEHPDIPPTNGWKPLAGAVEPLPQLRIVEEKSNS